MDAEPDRAAAAAEPEDPPQLKARPSPIPPPVPRDVQEGAQAGDEPA